MLLEQTLDKLTVMKMHGMVHAVRDWIDGPKQQDLSATELLGIVTDAEWVHRESKKLQSRLRLAAFKFKDACVEDIDYRASRGLNKSALMELMSSRWVASHRNIILTGPTGVGKSWLACALGQKACRDGYTVMYKRLSRLFDELDRARGDGSYHIVIRKLARTNVLILDDFGMEVLEASQRKDLLEIIDDRYHVSSTIITSQLEPKHWHGVIGDETHADAICDRVVHNAKRIHLKGESLRKTKTTLTQGKTTSNS